MEMKFCRRCGEKLTQKTTGFFACTNDHKLFANPAPAASVFFVNHENKVLFSVRGIEPYKGMLDTVGGFVNESESLEQAVVREIEEELGLKPEHYDDLQFLCSYPSIYPYDGEDRSILGAFFWARLKPGAKPIARDDVASIKFLDVNEVDPSEIGNGDVKLALRMLQKVL